MKRYPLSILCATAIAILSLAPMAEMPELQDVPLIDKWVHFVMYGGLTSTIWWESRRRSAAFLATWGFVFPVCYGGLMELAQAYLTTYRSGDWLDVLANSIGVVLGILIGCLIRWRVCTKG